MAFFIGVQFAADGLIKGAGTVGALELEALLRALPNQVGPAGGLERDADGGRGRRASRWRARLPRVTEEEPE